MFYWIRLTHWYYDDKEEQFYPNEEKEMFKFIKEHLKNNWVISCMKLMNNIKV